MATNNDPLVPEGLFNDVNDMLARIITQTRHIDSPAVEAFRRMVIAATELWPVVPDTEELLKEETARPYITSAHRWLGQARDELTKLERKAGL